MMPRGAVIFVFFLLAVSLFFAVGSFNYSGMAGFVPLVLAIPTALLAVVVLVGEWFPSVTRYFEVGLEDLLSTGGGEGQNPPVHAPRAGEIKLIVQTFGWFVAFALILFLAGFYVAAALFALPFMRFQGKIDWLGSMAVTLLVEAFFYVVFEQLLNVNLFEGVLFGSFVLPL
ncbi:MAG: tripartite tricarboxylate transporter TctB family protein [Candidatus Binatia bacterium]